MSSAITLFLKEWPGNREKAIKGAIEAIESNNKAIREFTNQLQGLTTLSHSNGTNAYTLEFKSPTDMIHALPKIKKTGNILLYYPRPDYLKEVSDAIDKDDYFKAYSLCVTLYESYGKDILSGQFKDRPELAKDITNKLLVTHIMDLLCKHGVTDKSIRSEMFSVNDTRNEFIHRYLSSQLSPELQKRIKRDAPKIMKTLKILKEIHDKLPKELDNVYLNSWLFY